MQEESKEEKNFAQKLKDKRESKECVKLISNDGQEFVVNVDVLR